MSISFPQQRTARYVLIGACLGFLCPIGWFVLRFIFFRGEGLGLLSVVTDGVYSPAEHLALTLYMGLGTAAVFALFARYFSIASQTLQERAQSLDELNRSMAQQAAVFEARYKALDASLKHFHITNAHIQRSVDTQEVFQLAADCLHEVLGYDRVNILMRADNGTALKFVASRGVEGTPARDLQLPLDERSGVLGLAMRENRIYLVEDIQTAPAEYRLLPPCDAIVQLRSRNFIICPISHNGMAIGVFGVDNKSSRRGLDETDVEAVRLFAEQVSTALNRIQLVQGVESLIEQLQHTFLEVSRYRGSYADMVHSLKGSSAAAAQTVAGIAQSAETVRGVVEDTSSATTQISHAIDEVNHNFDKLQQFVEHSIATMTQIAATARQVEHNATVAHELAETVQANAAAGVNAVDDTFHGLENISRAVDESRNVIEDLAVKGREIDGIIEVINEINQKTNLLSLNAAIIAAQSGEQGRSFAVVADQIRGLSRETEQSAGAIAALVKQIQEYTELAVKNIGETRTMVDRDIALGQTTGHALQLILGSAEKSMSMAREIRKSTAEQVLGSQSIARSIEELGGMSGHLLQASREQSQGIRRIVKSMADVKRMSDDMVAATNRQGDAIQKIDRDVEQVNGMSQHIFSSLAARQSESYRVIEQLEAVKREGR